MCKQGKSSRFTVCTYKGDIDLGKNVIRPDYQGKTLSLVSYLKAKNTLEELDVLRFFEFKVEEFPYKTFFYDYDDLKAINKSGYTEHYLGKCIAKCFFRLSKVFFIKGKR